MSTNADSGPGSLRQALLDANAAAGADAITFASVMTITPASALPTITEAITIDGASVATGDEPGVIIDGASAGPGASGLIVTNSSGSSSIRSLQIVNFAQSGIVLSGTSGALVESNVIAGSGAEGIRVEGSTTGNRIQGNRIFANGGLGIDLGGDGITANDAGDPDIGPNRLQNFPVISDATLDGTSINGTLDAAATDTYVIEVFQNDDCDDLGNGEGHTLVGSTAPAGPGPWAIDAGPINGTFLSAVAINVSTGDTSEFGPCFEVTDGLPAPGTWVGEKTQSGGGVIPGGGDIMAAGTNAPAGPAQFTYGAIDPDSNGGASSPSGEWFFYTTAASTGTMSVPWRWSGFHGYAGVDILLEAVVIRGLDEQVFTEPLVDAGPVSCDPCVEPSGGFDYDDSVDFPVEARDIYGFRITSSNGDTNASLLGQLLLGNAVPRDCADAQDLYGATVDGRYFIHPQGGQEFSVHCADMGTEAPKDYLALHPEYSGVGRNTGQYAAGGFATGSDVTTTFSKLRLDPSSLTVDIGDTTFATTAGELTHFDESLGSPTVEWMPLGTAMGCGNPGQANIDVRGTPFAIDDSWTLGGTAPSGSVNHFANIGESFFETPQVANISGNGSCGWNSPNPAAFNPFNPSPGDFSLQLRYLNESTAPPAPVLFRAVPNGTNTATGVVGRLNAAPGEYTITLYASTSCTGGTLGEDATLLGTADVVVGADDQTYFSQLVSHGTSTRRFVALTAIGGGDESAPSACIAAQADNDVWPRASELAAGATATSVSGWIDQPGLSRWYKFEVDPGAQLTINLTDLPADYDIFLFKDIQQAYDEQAGLSDTADLTKLSAEFAATSVAPQGYAPQAYAPQGYAPQAYAPQAYAPEVYAPQAYAPQGYAPQAYAPQGYAPQGYAPQGYAPQGYAPQAYAPQAYAPQAYAPDIFAPQAYAAAQVTSLVALAAHTGTGTETIVANTWNNTGEFYVRVSGKNGVLSTAAPFNLDVSMQSNICDDLVFDDQAPLEVQGEPETLILHDFARMTSTTAGNARSDKDLLAQRLSDFSLAVNGTRGLGVVDVNADPGVGAMNLQADAMPSCPFAKNLVANEIKDIVDAHRTEHPNTLKYVVLVGGDDVIPFFRYADQALLGPEQDFVPPVDRTTSSEASLRSNYVLGQDEYGSTVTLSHGLSTLPIPDLPVGRLVETAKDATTALDGYLALTDGVVPTPKTSLVTGYDFIADASEAIKTELRDGIGTGAGTSHDELMTAYDVSPLDSRSWTATQFKEKLQLGHDLMFLGGHFSADSALAADFSTSVTTADLPPGDALTNAIVFSIGCHSGYNTVDGHAIDQVTQKLDWPQAFAQKKATLIAGTGYQYGDTDFVEYSERIYLQFARELRTGTGPVAVGDALVRSKQTYLRLTNDLRGLHEKALLESALYGLPMLSVNMTGTRLPTPADDESIVEDTDFYETNPGAELGLVSEDVDVTSPLIEQTKPLVDITDGSTINPKWYSGPDGVVTHQNEPAIPLDARNASVQGKVLRGVLWMGGEYTDETVVPLTGAPATESRGVHTRFASPVFYPIRPWSVNYTDALTSAGGSTDLLVTPAQHKGSPTSDAATLRTYDTMGFKLLYSSYTGPAALSAPPEISSVSAAATGNVVTFEARVAGNPAAGVQEVWVLYTTGPGTGGAGSWIPLELTQDAFDTTLWRATEPITAGQSIRYLVQAANGLGLVSMSENYGQYYEVSVAGVQPPPPAATSIDVSGPASGVHAGNVAFTATLKQGTTGLSGKTVVISAGGISRLAPTNSSGVATVELPLLVLPGSYTVSATFGGDTQHASSSATRTVSVAKAPTTLTLAAANPSPAANGSVTLVATLKSGAVPLVQRTVAFLVTSSGGAVTLQTQTTDLVGQARLRFPTGMTGVRQVEVRFGSLVSAAGVSVDLTDARYLPSSASTWPFTGFFAPVDNQPTINVVKAGNAVPVKFSLGGNRGLTIFRAGYPAVVAVACQSGLPVDEIESTTAANSSGLLYDSSSAQYTYVWKTPKKVGCHRLDFVFTDGTVQSAMFKLR